MPGSKPREIIDHFQVVPIVLANRVGKSLCYDGGLATFKVTGGQTAGGFLLFEALMPRGKATPLHLETEEETFYVLEGEVLLHIDGKEFLANRPVLWA